MKGTVKFFDRKQQYGFIVCDGIQQDVYFKIEDILNVRRMKPGTAVQFDYESLEGDRFRAYDICPLGGEGQQSDKKATQDMQRKTLPIGILLLAFAIGVVAGWFIHLVL